MRTNEHNPMDELLRRCVEEAPVPFKDEYWEKMSAALDEEDKGSKKPFLWRGLSILAIVLTLGLGAYVFPKLNSSKKAHETQHAVKPIQGSLASVQQDASDASITSNSNFETTTNIAPNVNGETSTTQTSSSNTSNDETENGTHAAPTSVTTSPQTINPLTTDIKNEQKSQPEAALTSSDKKASSDNSNSSLVAEKKVKHSAPTTQPSTTNAVDEFTTQDATKQGATSMPKEKKRLKRGTSQSAIAKKDATLKETVAVKEKETPALSPATTSVEQPIVNVHGKPMKRVDSSVTVRRDETSYNPRYMASLSNYIPERLDSVTTLRYQPMSSATTDAASANSAEGSTNTVVKENPSSSFGPKSLEFFLMAGMNMNKGFAGNVDAPIKWGFSPYVGAGLSKAISSKITLASHVGFTYFNGLNTEKKVTNYVYSFGYDSTQFSVQHKKMFEMYLPISLYYQVIRNHYLMASIGGSYAMDVSSSVKANSQAKATNQNGYRSGFNAVDIFAGLGYSVQVFRNLMLQFGFQYGILDRTKNDYFNSNQHHSQTRFSLGIKYSFSRNEP